MLATIFFSACGHHQAAHVNVPPAPPTDQTAEAEDQPARPVMHPGEPVRRQVPQQDESAGNSEDEDAVSAFDLPLDSKTLLVEKGLASWYGPPYHNRRGANGKIYNMHAMTAAHRTLPLGSIVRVTNIKTGDSAVVQITDRGPFVEGRILDLSLAAAKKTGVWRAGVAQVRMELLQTPASLETGGRWAVQIGGFEEQNAANKMVDRLSHRYHTAKVQCFSSPVGEWWVRVRVPEDEKKRAEEIAHATASPEGGVFLVRLD